MSGVTMEDAGKPAISFIGLGAMGFGMATYLVQQGYSVAGFDAYGPTLERFAAAGGEGSPSLAACVQKRPVCIVMVATAAQAQSALFSGASAAALALPHGAVLLLCSTVPATYVRGLSAELAQRSRSDIQLVDCPVSGGAVRAAEGSLSIMAGGSAASLAAGRPILRELAADDKLYEVRGGIGAGSNMKMCHQVLAACQILGASEAMGFAARLGLHPPAVVRDVLAGEAWTWMFENRAPRITHPGFQPLASALAIIAKDTAIITSEARRVGFAATMAGAAEQAYLAGMDRGWAGDDDAGVVRLYLAHDASGLADAAGTSEDPDKLKLVAGLMKATNTLAAAEALALASAVGIDLAQLHSLAAAAAGGSWVLREGAALHMMAKLASSTAPVASGTATQPLADLVADLRNVLDEAARVKCPLYLGNAAYGIASSVWQKEGKRRWGSEMLLQYYTEIAGP